MTSKVQVNCLSLSLHASLKAVLTLQEFSEAAYASSVKASNGRGLWS
jgi:hypothetical protein